ncbi:hypothetical protein H8A99_39700, partial [Bradyrhizobium sp. Arg68]|uniref:hypothetical protein n=1 Tax=Bradyrhizobium ivorense TaxID=2511166 RepID=UPI001E43D35B
MLSRALSLATVTLLIGLMGGSAHAQNLEAGKSPSQIFAGTCAVCHKSPRGLLKSVPAGSLPSFLRQHYTTSSDMAGVLASFLISNGANDPRYQAKDHPRDTAKGAKGARDGRQEANQSPEQPVERPSRRQHQGAAPQEAARPDADGLTPQQGEHPGRRGKRMARPTEAGPEGASPETPAAGEGRPSRQKLGRRGKPSEEPKADEGAKNEGAKSEAPKNDSNKNESNKSESSKDDSKSQTANTSAKGEDKREAEKPAKPADQSDSAKVDAPKESVGGEPGPQRSDPVPPVT